MNCFFLNQHRLIMQKAGLWLVCSMLFASSNGPGLECNTHHQLFIPANAGANSLGVNSMGKYWREIMTSTTGGGGIYRLKSTTKMKNNQWVKLNVDFGLGSHAYSISKWSSRTYLKKERKPESDPIWPFNWSADRQFFNDKKSSQELFSVSVKRAELQTKQQ